MLRHFSTQLISKSISLKSGVSIRSLSTLSMFSTQYSNVKRKREKKIIYTKKKNY